MSGKEQSSISFFNKYLSVWVAICMVVGVLVGKYLPAIPEFFGKFEYVNVSIPTAVLIWVMIYPMMIKVDFPKRTGRREKSERALCHLGSELAHQTFHHVRHFRFFLLCRLQEFHYARVGDGVLGRCDPLGSCAVYGHGVCLEPIDKRQSGVHSRSSCDQ